eukprot:236213_1
MSYNPYVTTSLIKAAVSEQSDSDQHEKKMIQQDTKKDENKEITTIQTTLPIYNGGSEVRVRKCDRNTYNFELKKSEWKTSWLRFEVSSDKILTAEDDFIGAVNIDFRGIKNVNQIYYTQLPLINKKNYSKQMQMKTEKAYQRRLAKNGDKKIGYEKLVDIDDDSIDIQTKNKQNAKKENDLSITGQLHVKAIKRSIQVYDENKSDTYTLEIEILAITNMTTLKLDDGMDKRTFYGGILAFIVYLLFYAGIMFIAELHTSTGMNEYKESIWFALITVTTLGYGDIYAQTRWSKFLNAFFITTNIILITGFISNLLGYIVDAGEEALDERMDDMVDGAEVIHKQQQDAENAKTQQFVADKSEPDDSKHRRKSVPNVPKDAAHSMGKRRQSEPALNLKSIHEEKLSADNEEEKKHQKEVDEAKIIEFEVKTTKVTKIKLNELVKLDNHEKNKFRTQIYTNVFLFVFVLLFGFFALGVSILLTGPNYLTNLPYFGYECDGDNDPLCQLDKSAGPIFVDSLYYTIVSMTTVGYGDIYPKPTPGARMFGSLFILFGTMLLARLIELILAYMLWKRNFVTKQKALAELLTSCHSFFEFDTDDKNATITKYQFFVNMLLKLDLVEMPRINEIMSIFHKTDADGNGVVDVKELRQKVEDDLMKLKWGESAWKEIKKEWNSIQTVQEKIKLDRKEIKTAQEKIQTDEKELKIKEDEINEKIKKFEIDKKKWELQQRKIKNSNGILVEEDSKDESVVMAQAINDEDNNVDIINEK